MSKACLAHWVDNQDVRFDDDLESVQYIEAQLELFFLKYECPKEIDGREYTHYQINGGLELPTRLNIVEE